jgi:hypothetical protein
MRPLSVHELLGVWERGLASSPSERALAILTAACPESPPAELACVSVGRRDGHLMTIREWAFGPDFSALADCPRCHQPLETILRVRDLRVADEAATEGSVTVGRYAVRCRPPNTTDLLACEGQEAGAIRLRLLASCVTEAVRDVEPVSAGDLPDEVVREVVERIAALDPQADTRINLSCPDCHYAWSEVFDVVSFFWTEIDAWARRFLRDVNALARAYGWREQDIVALSPMRRQLYLAMAQA